MMLEKENKMFSTWLIVDIDFCLDVFEFVNWFQMIYVINADFRWN